MPSDAEQTVASVQPQADLSWFLGHLRSVIPTAITLLRLALAPVFVLCLLAVGQHDGVWRFWAITVFLIAALSDAIDGYLARRWQVESKLGALLDPIADWVLLVTAFVSLTALDLPAELRVPAWVAVVVVTREAILLAGALCIHLSTSQLRVQPTLLGKAAVAAQMTAIVAILAQIPGHQYILWAAVICTVFSMVDYIRIGTQLLNSTSDSTQS